MFDVRNSAPPQRSAHAGRNVACQVLMPPESSRFSRFAHLGFAVETKAPAWGSRSSSSAYRFFAISKTVPPVWQELEWVRYKRWFTAKEAVYSEWVGNTQAQQVETGPRNGHFWREKCCFFLFLLSVLNTSVTATLAWMLKSADPAPAWRELPLNSRTGAACGEPLPDPNSPDRLQS